MRASRRLLLICAALVLLVLAAACGNDAGQGAADPSEGDGTASEPSASETGAASSEAASEEASAIVPLDQVCEEKYADVQAPDGFKVGLVTDIGSVDDGTFNQYAFEGMKAAEACFGIETNFIETANQSDYAQNMGTILQDKPNVVVTVGFLLAEDTLAFANKNKDVNFVGVDQFQPKFPANYSGVLFREDQGGFLAGAMAGLLTESNVIGVVGGLKSVPPVVRLVNGYRRGAEYVAEQKGTEVNVLETYNESFTDPAKGKSDAQQFLGEGADVVFGAGGQTGSGGIRAAAENGAWAIGVDQDEYFTTFSGGDAKGADKLATSAIKRVDLGVFDQIAAAIQNQFKGGTFILEAANDGITYAPFHDADIPEDAAATMEEIRQGLADGSIDTGVDPITGELK